MNNFGKNLLWEIFSDVFGPNLVCRKESFPTFWQQPSLRNRFGLARYQQNTTKIPQKSVVLHKIYTPYAYLWGDARTHGEKIFTQYSGISSCSLGSTYFIDSSGFSNFSDSFTPPSTSLLSLSSSSSLLFSLSSSFDFSHCYNPQHQ